MADKKISQLTASTTPLAGTEELAVVQSGVTKKVSVANLTAGRTVSASELDVDNININGNVISSTNTDGDVVVDPNGTGQLIVYAPQVFTDDALFTTSDGAKVTLANTNNFASAEETVGHISFFGGDNSSPADSERAFIKAVYVDTANRVRLDIGTGNAAEAPATALSISPQKNVTVSTGNLVIGTSGKGIDFSADGSAAGMTSELLDDYEEGTWTPVARGSTTAGTATYTTQVGRYTKVGRLVTLHIELAWTGHTGTGNLLIPNIPFVSSSDLICAGSVYASDMDFGASATQLSAILSPGDTSIVFRGLINDAFRVNPPLDANVGSLVVTLTYQV